MNTTLSLQELQDAVVGNVAAFRCRRRLQPGGGAGDKVFPPTLTDDRRSWRIGIWLPNRTLFPTTHHHARERTSCI